MADVQGDPRVVIIGGGFGGVGCGQVLDKHDVPTLLVDRNDYHQFQPMLYQLATAQVGATDIAFPLRSIFRPKSSVTVRTADIASIDPAARSCTTVEGVTYSGEVLVIAAAGHAETAMIGEILGGHLRRRGACGLVCDGAIRDVATLAGWDDFPVFTRYVTPRGPSAAERGAVNRPVIVGGCLVTPGDLVIGDDDGLVSLTPSAVRGRIGDAEAKLALEAEWQAHLAGGRSVRETFGLASARGDDTGSPSTQVSMP